MRSLLSLLLVLLCACTAMAAEPAPPPDGYRIGPSDVIRIQVFGEDDLTVEGKVTGDGKINYPLLGALQVNGWTIEELQQELTARLASGYVRLPKVSVSIVRHRNFYVSGEVKTPGGYPYEEGLTAQKALSIAGGFTEKADKQGFKVTRLTHGRVETLAIGPDDVIQPNDSIVVTEGQRFYVSGEVKTPGRYFYEKGLTVQKAISMAGGVTEKAEKREIKVTRVARGLVETFRAEPELAVLPDDIIMIEPLIHKFYASGEVKTPGGYPYKDGLTVHKAIAMAGGLTEKAERDEFRVLRRTHGQEETLPVKLETLLLHDDIIVVAEGQRFYVSGEVKTPGRYLYEKGLTVHKAISMAGGVTEKAEKGEIRMTRLAGGRTETTAVDLNAPVLPDDFVIVERLQKIYVDGEVKKPGDYPYEKGITVHKVITMAGGFTDKASESRTKVLRVIDGQEQSVRIKLEDIVLPEDIIVVPRRFF